MMQVYTILGGVNESQNI